MSVHSRSAAWLRIALLPLAAVAVRAGGEPLCEREVLGRLAAQGFAVDTNAACRAAVVAAARTLDTRAELVALPQKIGIHPRPGAGCGNVEGGLLYLRLGSVRADAPQALAEAVARWPRADAAGAVLDLREAGGTEAAAAAALAGTLLGETNLLFTQVTLRGDTVQSYPGVPAGDGRLDAPLMALIGSDTRDAAELLAALLKGRRGVMLIGETTRGDARVREVVPLGPDTGLRIAVGRWMLQGGADYQGCGVSPDIRVLFSTSDRPSTNSPSDRTATGHPFSDKTRMDRELMNRVAKDACLLRATEILLALKALRAAPPAAGAGTSP